MMKIEELNSWINSQPAILTNLTLSIILLYSIYSISSYFRFEELRKDPNRDSSDQGSSLEIADDFQKSYNWKPRKFPDSVVWRTFTPKELVEFNGEEGKRILFAINRFIYDVTAGRNFYGPGGAYGNFAGRDASRGLAKQSFDKDVLTPIDEPIDKLEDLTEPEKNNLNEWEQFFKSKYLVCGELIENSERSSRPL